MKRPVSPIVSVVLPTQGRPVEFRRAVESVCQQSYENFELIVIDGSENEYPSDVITDLNPSYTTTIIQETEAKGVSAARNMAIRASEGQYIAFLDDDDEWESSKIEKQVRVLKDTTAVGVAYTGNRKVGPDGKTRATSTPSAEGDVTRRLLFGSLFGTFSTLTMEQELVDEVGLLDESLRAREDWDYYLRLSQATEFRAVPEPLVIKHTGDYEQLSDDFEAIEEGSWRLLEKHESVAKEYGAWRKMNARIRYGLGYSAAMRGDYGNARRYFAGAIRWHPQSPENYLWLGLVSGGPFTLKPAQWIKRFVVSITSD